MEVPKHLRHKPIVAVENYEDIDAQWAKNTDTKALSVGIPQWCNGNYDPDSGLSIKVWRHNGSKWNRNCEEVPVHRVLDMATLFVGALLHEPKAHYCSTSLHEKVVDADNFHLVRDFYENSPYVKVRLEELRDKINLLLDE